MTWHRSTAARPTLLAASLLILGGCAGMYDATGTASQQDMLQLRTDLNSLQVSAQRTRAEIDAALAQMDRRLGEQTADTSKQLAALAARLETLSGDVTALSGRADEMNQRLEALRKAAGRSAPAAAAPTAPSSPPATPSSSPAVVSPPPSPQAPAGPRPTTGTLLPEDVYQAAYIDFSKGTYTLAMNGFRDFLRRFPDHKLADNAQYWIGESHLALAHSYANAGQDDKATQELEDAVREFRRVITNYPRGEKVPTAIYKEALALLDLKKPVEARARLQYLIDNFPRAEETPLARDRLTALKDKP
jgi:tol-pal system protein YbgF